MRALIAAVLLVGVLIAGSIVYASTRTADVKIEPKAKSCERYAWGGCIPTPDPAFGDGGF